MLLLRTESELTEKLLLRAVSWYEAEIERLEGENRKFRDWILCARRNAVDGLKPDADGMFAELILTMSCLREYVSEEEERG